MQKIIDYFIVGAQKSATTSLYECLRSIDGVDMPIVKEMQIFTDDELYKNFPNNIEQFYNKKNKIKLRGMADVGILYNYEKTVNRIYDYNPDAKIVIMLRNPIHRSYSHYWFSRKLQREKQGSFEAAIKNELSNKHDINDRDRLSLMYLDVSNYYKQVDAFIEKFSGNVKVVLMEEYLQSPYEEFGLILEFLGLDLSAFDERILTRRFNEGGGVKNKVLQSILSKRSWIKDIYKAMIPLKIRLTLRTTILVKVAEMNHRKESYPEISNATYSKLVKYFYNDCLRLSKLINKDLNCIWFDMK